MPLVKLLTVILAAAPLLAAAFPWGDMSHEAEWWRVRWLPFVSGYRVKDVILNVLITTPVGLAAAASIKRHPSLAAVLVTLCVSILCEWAQIYAPDRYPSGTDVLCNVLGATAGVLVLRVGWPQWSAGRQYFLTKDPREED